MSASKPAAGSDWSILAFLGRYVRRYAGWGMASAVGILIYAAATAGIVFLIKPIFSEVLLAGDRVPGALSAITSEEPATTRSTPAPTAAAPAVAKPEGLLERFKRRFNLSRQLDSSYASLKSRLGIGPDGVVYFVPLLFAIVFLLRSLADFGSGYSFQRIGFGVTTDIRNDLYRRILEQSSRFHAEHPSGELVARVINDVAMMQSATIAGTAAAISN